MGDVDFIALPKIELHAHLTGSVSRRTLHDIWLAKEATGSTDLEDPLVVMPEGKNDYNLETFFPLFSSYIYNLLSDSESIKRATTAVLESFAADGVVYLELRTTPRKTSLLTPAENIAAVVSAISEFDSRTMHTRLILSIDRRHDLETAMGVVELAKAHKGVVVGVDLCGDPKAKPNGEIRQLREAFLEAKRAGLEVTVHFAEAQQSGSREECDELLSWQPGRLGHVIWEDDEVKAEISKRELCLELCLSCNVQASMMKCGIECGDHHFGYWRGVEGPKIALSTDDVGVFGSPLSNEYRLAADHFSLNRAAVCGLARQPIDGIFGGDDEKKRLREIMWT